MKKKTFAETFTEVMTSLPKINPYEFMFTTKEVMDAWKEAALRDAKQRGFTIKNGKNEMPNM